METLKLINLTKHYKKKHAVNGITLTINKGDVLGLLGENGAGKSTTMGMIATLIKPDDGDVFVDNDSVVIHPEIMKKKLGYVPQDIALYPMLTGLENLKFWGKLYHLKKNELDSAIKNVSEIISLSKDDLNRKVSEYSGGMKRRVNIGAALLHDPELVIMDEPTVGIDVKSRNQITDAILELNKNGKTIIYSGHYMPEMEKICNRICMLDAGKIKFEGYLKDLLVDEGQNISLEEFYLKKTKDFKEEL